MILSVKGSFKWIVFGFMCGIVELRFKVTKKTHDLIWYSLSNDHKGYGLSSRYYLH